MAFAYLNLPGRIWRDNGLKYLLSPEDLPQERGLCASPKLNISEFKTNFSPKPKAPKSIFQAPTKEEKPSHAQDRSAWKALPLESWPEQWQKQFSCTRKGRFAWTYMDLGSDLLMGREKKRPTDPGNLIDERRKCLSRLLKDLGHPGGTHTFWPVAMPQSEGGDLVANSECFWSGLSKLECRGVIIMGSLAAQAVMETQDIKPLDHLFKFGQLVWILWEPHVIISKPEVYGKALAFLKSSLGKFVRI